MGAGPDEGGLLGKLPRTRPAVESPRRLAARKAQAGSGPERGRAPAATADPQRPALEQLARAGAGAASGVAAAGLRLAGRAVGEIGKAVGRR